MKIPHVPSNPQATLRRLLSDSGRQQPLDLSSVDVLPGGRYRHWEKLRFLTPPSGLTSEEWWALIKLARTLQRRPVPLTDSSDRPFTISTPDPCLELLSRIDRELTGTIAVDEPILNQSTRDRYLFSSLIEEAISSSQIEGAVTTRVIAKELLQSRRRPRDRSETMIANNYAAMSRIREIQKEPLSVALLHELQRIVTDQTLDDTTSAGRLRRPDERIVVLDTRDNVVLHDPPPAKQLPDRMEALCRFANGETPKGFMHPVVRASILHFWLAYDHPFVDGNGRTARALFYWSMLRSGYWLTEFISISSIVAEARGRYRRAFLYTETDDNDLTYFVLWQLSVVIAAAERLRAFLGRKTKEIEFVEARLKRSRELNQRQLALLAHAHRHADAEYSAQIHAASHGVSLQTARTDLDSLVSRRLLKRTKRAKKFVYSPAPNLERML